MAAGLPMAAPALAAESGRLPGDAMALAWGLPFLGLLLSIAFVPLAAPKFWHTHFGKVSAAWSAALVLPAMATFGARAMLEELWHVMVADYVPFVVLLLALYTIGGGVRIAGAVGGTPARNAGVLALGAALAGVIGTTAAAMLLIHTLLRANAWRRHRAHIVIFFIFAVGNIGGALSPLGDPPLFIGFLKGVDFFWPMTHLFWPMLLCLAVVLPAFWAVDVWFLRHDDDRPSAADIRERPRIEGGWNLALLALAVGAVLASGLWPTGRHLAMFGVQLEYEDIARTAALLALAAFSLRITPAAVREANAFHWFPMIEIAKLFAGIFVTVAPLIAVLKAGSRGAAAPLLALLNAGGAPDEAMYFWMTGLLSAFLDNAPTYLVFFNLAGGDARALMGPLAGTLAAISAGAVFMGALTYIGNAPNFMIKAIAEDHEVKMPSFFGYMAWSLAVLGPTFLLVSFAFF
jgi:Na+/H+ antiporter NhaD/arsenite permease-like protein